MSVAGLRMSLIGLTLLAAVAGLQGVTWSLRDSHSAIPIIRPTAHVVGVPGNIGSKVQHAVERAPFRSTRLLATAIYDPDRAVQPVPAVMPQPSRPVLTLSGTVLGREAMAIIEGFPGIDGPRTVRRGDVVGELKIGRIDSAGATVTGLDTTWHLHMRTSWQ